MPLDEVMAAAIEKYKKKKRNALSDVSNHFNRNLIANLHFIDICHKNKTNIYKDIFLFSNLFPC